MSTKKCACFTPSGLVYTRLETDGTIARRPSEVTKESNSTTRTKRSIGNDVYEPNTVDSILEENPSIGHLRFRNEPINELENESLHLKIDKLIKETEAFLAAYEHTKEVSDHKRIKRRAQHLNHNKHKHKNDALINSNESSLECKIERDGTVNCSQVIYNDLKAWQTNRLSLEDQIRQLKIKLEDLKEIKRHLKIAKPATETQTVHSNYVNNYLHNRSVIHEHNSSKDNFRKSRIHRLKPKHRNSTYIDKKIRMSNEFFMPTISVTKDVFGVQSQNKSKTVGNAYPNGTNGNHAIIDKNNILDSELPKPLVTTVIIDDKYNENGRVRDESVITSTDTFLTTEYANPLEFSTTNKEPYDQNSTIQSTTEYYTQNARNYSLAIDKILAKDKTTIKMEVLTSTTIKPSTIRHTTHPTWNLGPARLDASEYEQRNPNKGSSKNMGVFDKPVDVFQRRLHPLFIENEDKHVCYCEENRLVFNLVLPILLVSYYIQW